MQNKISERLKELRAALGLSQAKLAIKLGISEKTYGAWEEGRSQPSADTLIQLAAYFEVTTDYILGYSNDTYQSKKD